MDMVPEVFEHHLRFLKQNGYSVVPAIEFLKRTLPNPFSSVVLTFDDGCENFYTEAFPRLLRYGFTATVFIVTDWIGKKGYLSWQQLRELQNGGMTIGSHTCSHPHLPDLDPSQIRREIEVSKKNLEEGLHHPVSLFCYPFGGFNAPAIEFVRSAGYQLAFTTNRSLPNFPQAPFSIRRIRMGNTTHSIHLWAKCSGYYNLFRSPRPAH